MPLIVNNPYQFERVVGELFQKMGYATTVTPRSGDYGIDVIAKKGTEVIAIQVKFFKPGSNIGNGDVQKLLGAMQLASVRANKSILITTSDFTVMAQEQAKQTPIELWNGAYIKSMLKRYYNDDVVFDHNNNNRTQTNISNNRTQTNISNNRTQTSISNNRTQTNISNNRTQTSISNNRTQTSISNNYQAGNINIEDTEGCLSIIFGLIKDIFLFFSVIGIITSFSLNEKICREHYISLAFIISLFTFFNLLFIYNNDRKSQYKDTDSKFSAHILINLGLSVLYSVNVFNVEVINFVFFIIVFSIYLYNIAYLVFYYMKYRDSVQSPISLYSFLTSNSMYQNDIFTNFSENEKEIILKRQNYTNLLIALAIIYLIVKLILMYYEKDFLL